MKIYDITQELFSCNVYTGDTAPTSEAAMRISEGDPCNLTDINICVHNGTHIDAPYHFFADGRTVDEIDLAKCMGKAVVRAHSGELTAESAKCLTAGSPARLLIKGKAELTPEAAEIIVRSGVVLLGVEEQSVSGVEDAEEVHKILLSAEIVILEGIVLSDVPCGEYILSALPMKLGGTDGAPCRAVLISEENS